MTVDLVIKNAKIVIPPDAIAEGSIAIDEGKIVSVCRDSAAPQADRVVDAKGKVLMPGVIDPHTHLGYCGRFESDFVTESASAAIGGVTSIINYYRKNESYNLAFPPVREIADRKSLIDFSFHLALVNDLQIQELSDYVESLGITSFKLHLDYKSTGLPTMTGGDFSIDDGFVYRVLERLGTTNRNAKACVHCENIEVIRDLTRRIQNSRNDLKAWAESRPGFTEAENLTRMMYLSAVTGAKLHVVHVSCRETVAVLRKARREGTRIGAETQIHYLTQSEDSPAGVLAKVKPPLRKQDDVQAVWSAITDGTVNVLSSDHVPNSKEQKMASGDIWSAPAGFPSCPLILPLLISEGFHKNRIALERISQITAYNTAKSFGLYPRKGSMLVGSDADLVLVDLNKRQKVTPELLRSGSDYTIYDGWEVLGWPTLTLVRGNIIFEEGQITGRSGWGEFIPRRCEAAI